MSWLRIAGVNADCLLCDIHIISVARRPSSSGNRNTGSKNDEYYCVSSLIVDWPSYFWPEARVAVFAERCAAASRMVRCWTGEGHRWAAGDLKVKNIM